ncbi:MAG: type II toxin-antitoxin system Phd/YefM family antitoxin, partial [Saprospiraceae bacterium]|nr:type II toxin-antitoxin system Phd/YefM family antitoxin [Saprospiraceae bacterium]
NATALISKLRETKRPLIITQRGKSSAVILDVSEYEALLSKIELLEDIALAEKQIDEGRLYSHESTHKAVLESLKR